DGRAPRLAEALALVARHTQEERFAELLAALAGDRSKLRMALGDGEAALRARLAAVFSVPDGATPDDLTEAFCAVGACDEAGLRAAAAAPAEGSAPDQEPGRNLAR